jgi:tRNA/tmRNA/rRNA uracil-C5-methylase (TrmA/RlmC/RlmD family)
MRNPNTKKKRDSASESLKSVEARSRKPGRRPFRDDIHEPRQSRRPADRDREHYAENERRRELKKVPSLFLDLLSDETGVDLCAPRAGAEPLAMMKYGDECAAKEKSFHAYWERACGGEGKILPIIESPRARGYRTTNKRRANPGKKVLLRPDEGNSLTVRSLLEPKEHVEIYETIETLINEPINKDIAKRLNFAIIRGDYEHFCVIFNVDALSAPIVRGFTKTAEKLAAAHPCVTSAFIYHDPSRSKYYLETSIPTDIMRLKKIFGPKYLCAKAGGIDYSFGPTAFSQVNLSIAGKMLDAALSLLAPGAGTRLLDLYCGYGFFSCYLASRYDEVVGADYERSSIESAQYNAGRLDVKTKFTFHSRKVEPPDLMKMLPKQGKPEHILLDPPRKGCASGVIELLSTRQPEKVLHIFCGIDTIPHELRTWADNGYRPETIQPLDMFPGTPNLEVMVLLRKSGTKIRR